MAGMALAMGALMALAIYSFSQMSSAPWTSALSDPKIESSEKKPLPPLGGGASEGPALTPQNFEGKWTLLSFWSHTCPPCLQELPALNQLSLGWQGPEFQVITVNVDSGEDLDFSKTFLQENEIVLPTIFDRTGELKKAFAVSEYPKHFLVSPEQQIVWEAVGAYKWNDASARDQLLKLLEQYTPETAPDPGE